MASLPEEPEIDTPEIDNTAVEAARARASVGEISSALEKVWGRHAAEIGSISGVYGAAFDDDAEWKALQGEIAAFAEAHGRRPRMLVAKIGQDGHDRGAKVIAAPSPTSVSTSTSARSSRRPRRLPARRSRTTST
jgi:methylmalonyl-CoA mutase